MSVTRVPLTWLPSSTRAIGPATNACSCSFPAPVDVLVTNATASYPTIQRCVPGPGCRREAALLWINSAGPLWLIRQLLPGMIDQGYGTIVNVAGRRSDLAAFPALQVADGMSNAALAYLTEHLAAELAHLPIDVFTLCPGPVGAGPVGAGPVDQVISGSYSTQP